MLPFPACVMPHNLLTVCHMLQALMRGEWKQAYDTLASLPCWALLADTDKVLGMLRSKLQEQGLIVYLLAYGSFYHSLSHKHLTSLFELPSEKVSGWYRACQGCVGHVKVEVGAKQMPSRA